MHVAIGMHWAIWQLYTVILKACNHDSSHVWQALLAMLFAQSGQPGQADMQMAMRGCSVMLSDVQDAAAKQPYMLALQDS